MTPILGTLLGFFVIATYNTSSNQIVIVAEGALLSSTVTLAIISPLLLLNHGQLAYNNPQIISEDKFSLDLLTPVLEPIFLSYQKPVNLATPQLRYTDLTPVETQKLTQVRFESALQGVPSTGTASIAENSFGINPTVGDFISFFGEREAIGLSNLEGDRREGFIDRDRIRIALEDAMVLLDSYLAKATTAKKLLLHSTRRRSALIIARYYLDSVRRRTDVLQDYERVIKEWEIDSDTEPSLELPNSFGFTVLGFTGNCLDC